MFRYFTTPIYYANGMPHAGHVYTTLLGQILKTHYSDRNFQVKFLTGLDEHGETVAEKAQELGVSPQALVDSMATTWQQNFQKLGIQYDIFMRTSSPAHKENVQRILSHCYENGDIYFGSHEGHYCVKCESFLNASERDKLDSCLIHKRKTEIRKEENYFFAVSKYKAKLKELIQNGEIVTQERFKNELLGVLDVLEGDLSISRPKERLSWGIELPFDAKHTTYVWFDALPNYLTGIGGLENAKHNPYWQNVCHLLGKDILKFHGIFWPAMCLSLNLSMPKLLVHGWLLKDGHKMSKTLGNVITFEQICTYDKDLFINAVFRTSLGDDIDLSWKTLFERFNADLANGVGNLLSRTLTLCQKQFQSQIPNFYPEFLTEEQIQISQKVSEIVSRVCDDFDNFRLGDALNQMNMILSLLDKYLSEQKPWTLNATENKEVLSNILYVCLAALRIIGFCFHAFFADKMKQMLNALGEDTEKTSDFFIRAANFFQLNSGFTFDAVPKLFARLDIAAELKRIETVK